MLQFKNDPDFKLYLSESDSGYIDKALPDHLVHSKDLGKMKLENTLAKAIFLAPKVYYLETIEDKVIYKVKGLKHEIELNRSDFESLLYKDTILQKSQSK